jgi:UTP-glucose-1-phosphate uridylyltransferase
MEEAFDRQILKRYQGLIQTDVVFQEGSDLPNGFSCPAERQRPWGTGQAVLAARKAITEPFGIINADDYYGPSAYQLLAESLSQTAANVSALTCVAYPLQNTLSEHGSVNRGLCEVQNGFLSSVTEILDIAETENGIIGHPSPDEPLHMSPEDLVSMNCWGMTPALFPAMEDSFKKFLGSLKNELKDEFYLPAFINEQLTTKGLSCDVKTATDRWCGVTYPADKSAVQAQLKAAHDSGLYPKSSLL